MLPATVHRKLETYWHELADREDNNSVLSTQSLESLSLADRQSWDLLRKELQQAGITVDVFEANKEYIFEWLVDKVSTRCRHCKKKPATLVRATVMRKDNILLAVITGLCPWHNWSHLALMAMSHLMQYLRDGRF
jgi:hypothetical protein